MTEQLLNRAQVRAIREEMGRKGMSQCVRADAELRSAQRDIPPHQPIDAAGREAAAAIVEEERRAGASTRRALGLRPWALDGKRCRAVFQPCAYSLSRAAIKRHEAF